MNSSKLHKSSNILLVVIGTSIQELNYAKKLLLYPEQAAKLFLRCGKKNTEKSKQTLTNALNRNPNTELVLFLAAPSGDSAIAQALELSRTAKTHNMFSFVVAENMDGCAAAYTSKSQIEKIRSYTESLLFIPSVQFKEKHFLNRLRKKEMQAKNFYKNANRFLDFVNKLDRKCGIATLGDMQYILQDSGVSFWAVGKVKGENRAQRAAHRCIDSIPRNVLISSKKIMNQLTISTGIDLDEVETACRTVEMNLHPDTGIVFGITFLDITEKGRFRVDLLVSGADLE